MIYGQRPDATACAPIELWNNRMGRWVNRGAKGIALIDDSGRRPTLKYVFDVSDTHPGNYRALTPRLWRMDTQYQDAAAEALGNAFGSPDGEVLSFADHIIAVSRIAAQDNLADYLDELQSVKTGSFLEELDDLNLESRFRRLVENSVAFTVLTRCGIDAGQFFENEDFDGLYDFNTFDTMSVLGTATSDVSRMMLLEIERTINGINRQKFANREKSDYSASKEAEQQPAEKKEEVDDHDRGVDVHDEGRLSVSRSGAPGADGGAAAGQVRPDAQEVSEAEPTGDVQPPAAVRQAGEPSGGDRPAGDRDGVLADGADGADGGRDGEHESDESDVVGTEHEQHPAEGGGDRYAATDLQLSHHDFDAPSSIPYYYHDAEKNELLRTSDALKEHRAEIAAFFAAHEDSEERGNFIRSFFDSTYVEQILSNDQRVGYRAYADVMVLWRGAYLSREMEEFMRWPQVADSIYGMMLLDQWLDPGEKPTPTVAEQMTLIEEAAADRTAAFVLPQEAIDYVLCRGSSFYEGKFRIYEQYQKKLSSAENIKFLKNEYGIGGSSSAIPGSGYMEDHDGKGITITRDFDDPNGKFVLTWNRIEKRIGELIAADRYLSRAEKEAYSDYQRKVELRAERSKIGDEFNSIILDYNDFQRQTGNADAKLNQYVLTDCGQSFSIGSKTTFTMTGTESYILPLMRQAMQTIIAEKTHLTERCEAMLTALDGDLAKPLEPTYEELNPPPPPKKEYRFSLGDTVYLGTQEYELLAFDEQEVRLYDTAFPLFNKTMPREEFDRKIAENPQNDHLLVVVEEQPAPNPASEQKAPGGDLWQAYSSAKAEHSSAIVLYQVGDFYEVLGEDARIAAEALDITLTTRNVGLKERVPMCGIPVRSGQTPLNMLLERGYDVFVVDDAGGTYPLPSYHKDAPIASRPVGRIDYPDKDGKIEYTSEYTDEHQFVRDAEDDSRNGTAMNIVVYRDKEGRTIPTDFVEHLASPPQSFTIADYEQERAETSLDRAKKLIDEYCEREFGAAGDYDDLSKVAIGHTTIGDEEIIVQAYADLINCRIDRYLDGNLADRREYDCLEDMIDAELEELDFAELIFFTNEQLDMARTAESAPAPTPIDRGDEMLQQAMLAAELSEQTGQNVFGFEEGSLQPVNVPHRAEKRQPTEQPVSHSAPAEKEEAPTLAPPAPRKREKVSSFALHPEIPTAQRHEYHITDDQLGVGTPSERYAHNVAAIRTLKKIESEDRLATPDEQVVLAQYVGWGGLSDCFDDRNSHYAELKALLTDEEYIAARESTLTAFYTPPTVIRAIYKALDNMGFQSGNILEPSCGVGNFLGMKPEKLADSKIYGVELDSISGRIARQLYQQSSIAVQGYEKTDIPDSFFDVALGNVPFGSFKVSDKRYDRHNFLIHDYFFARTLDKVRPGGIIAFITSKGTMDKESIGVRKYIAQRADLLGAIRLPNTTFKGAAGTEVTSDIIFLQKRDTLMDIMPDWVHLGKDENGLTMNQYFIDHPEMILGEMREVSGPYGPETACLPYNDRDLDTLLSEAIQNINGDIGEYAVEELAEDEEDRSIPADPSVRNFSFCLVDGKIYYRQDSRMVPMDVSATAESRIKGLVGIRDCVRTLIEYQTEDYPDSMIAAEQQKLNRLYDAFVKHYGRINSRANNSAFNSDSAYFLLSSLEVMDDEGNFVRKADMFSKRTIKQRVVVTSVDTASEALALSLAEKARIDMEYMSELTGKTEEEIFSDLKGVIFLNPMHTGEDSTNPKYLTADEYLSGNVREKLQWAKRSAELYPDDYAPNVQALEAVQPADLTAAEISVRLGATWLPTDVVEQFIYELFSTPRYAQWKIKVHYSQYTGDWNVENKNYDRGNVKALSTYGTTRINGYKIVEETLNLRTVRIFDYVIEPDGKRTPVLNKKETAIAQGKQELIKQAFQEWIWADQPRRERLCKLYNEKFNATRPREYDGSHLNFVGINPEITLRPHQVNAIAHILYGGNTLLAHVVGAGKTFEMVAAAQESKRLGLCQKSLFVVPNHLTEQWAAEYLQLYPSANILVATKKDFETKNRKRFCGRIATGDYDAIIIGHSQFEKIPMSAERQRALLEQQMDEIMAGIAELKENHGERFSIKQMERTKKSIQLKLDKLNDTSRKDDVVTFEELGVDRLFVDEAHYYKNLAAFSKMRNVGGISQTEAQKSSDLYMKCRYLDELTGGRGVVFATGTPISNSMVELYTMQKYLQYGTLARKGLLHFDSWASTFGETVTAIELAPEGSGYRAKTRFAKFYNLPELMSMFKEVADIQTADMLKLPVPKANYHNVVLKPSEHQKEMVAGLSERAEKVRNREVAPEVDNMLKITNDGRKLALDQRLMSELLPDSDTGKVAACAADVFDTWQRTAEQRSAQMIFCDLSTPHGDGQFNVYDDLRDKLIAKGIPAEEIAYIHNAKSEAQKKELFGKVRSGQIRVLIGSTQKMGAGTNAQRKLIALYHLDCPWRPADLQQREGRIIRQGNENSEVEITTYVTENTFDSYLYQLVEGKQKFIGQIMTSKSPMRSAEDIDETALSYAEIKALCTGNPYIKEKMDLDIDVQRLKLLKSSYLSQRYALEDAIVKSFPQQISALEQRIEGYTADMARVSENTHPNEDGFSPMVIEGKTYTEKKAAGSAIIEVCHNMSSPDPVPLGQYRGFDMVLSFDSLSREYKITLKGELHHVTGLGTDIFGNITRLDNALGSMEERRVACSEQLENVNVQLANAKEQVERPFPQEEELKTKSARLDELNVMLNLDKRESEVLDDGEVSEEDAERNQPKKKDRGIDR